MASSAEDAEGATSDMEVDKSGWAQLPEELIIQVLEQLGRVGRETSVVRLMCARWRSVHDHWAEQQGWAGLPEELMTMVLQRLQPQPPGAALLGFFESPSVVGQMGIPNFPSNGVLQATGQPSRQDARPVGFHRATAVVSCVCARWQRLHDALVTRLVVSYQVTDEQMHILVQRFPAATSVQVKGGIMAPATMLTDAGAAAVCGLPALTSLDLGFCTDLTDETLRTVSEHVSTLTSLNLTFCVRVTDAGMVAVSGMPALTSLDITLATSITVEGLKALSGMPALRILKGFTLSDESARAISTMAALTFLDAQPHALNGPSSETMRAISRLPALKSLILKDSHRVQDAAVLAVCNMPTLTLLDLSGCGDITDAMVLAVSRMPALTALDLAECENVTDDAVRAVSEMPALAALNLHVCIKVTMEGVRAASEMPTLTDLVISDRHNLVDGNPVDPQTTIAELQALRTTTAPPLRIIVNLVDVDDWELEPPLQLPALPPLPQGFAFPNLPPPLGFQ